MSSDSALLERQMAEVEVRPFTLDEFHRRRHQKQRNRRIATSVVGLVLVAVVSSGVVRRLDDDGQSVELKGVLGEGPSPFAGEWVSIDLDGSPQTMTIERTEENVHEIVIHDRGATVCSGAPATMTGSGQVLTASELIVHAEITCDDASPPSLADRDRAVLAHLTFIDDPETGRLADSTGVVWWPADPGPIDEGSSSFEGAWLTDGTELVSAASMLITHVADGDVHEIVMHGTDATRCAGANPASTLTGSGRRALSADHQGLVQLELAVELTCDDGTPLQPTGRNDPLIDTDGRFQISFTHDPVTDELASSLGGVWRRDGTERK